MGFLRDPEKLISALLTPRVWDWCEDGFRAGEVIPPLVKTPNGGDRMRDNRKRIPDSPLLFLSQGGLLALNPTDTREGFNRISSWCNYLASDRLVEVTRTVPLE